MTYRKTLITASAFVALLLPMASHATVRILDFDYDSAGNAIGNGTNITHQYAAWGVSVGACNVNGNVSPGTDLVNGVCSSPDLSEQDLTFNTELSHTADRDLEFRLRNNGRYRTRQSENQGGPGSRNYDTLDEYQDYYTEFATDENDVDAHAWERPGNVLIIQEHPDAAPDDEGSRPAGFFTFDFTSPVQILSLDFFDTEDSSNDEQARKIYFHLDSGAIVESAVPVLGNARYLREIYSSLFDVTKIVINLPGSGAINNLVYAHSGPTANVVSAPATIALILVGGLGIAYRRRKM